jgi:alpha-tubulin suppressor-like RCC1 family protein
MPPPDVPIGDGISELFVGTYHNCVRFGPEVRCWGYNIHGELGYGHLNMLGDEPGELPTPLVPVGGPVTSLCGGFVSTCAIRMDGKVHYWGTNSLGSLGNGNSQDVGGAPGELPTAPVPIGATAVAVDAKFLHSCALLDTGMVRCWGANAQGMLGYGHTMPIGDQPGELPTADVALGDSVLQVTAGELHSCAILAKGGVRCWGDAGYGQLGLGNEANVGDDELPDTVPLVPVL